MILKWAVNIDVTFTSYSPAVRMKMFFRNVATNLLHYVVSHSRSE